MKKDYLVMLFLVCTTFLWSQQKNVSGNVSDPDGNPLPGVSIIIEGTSIGTESDFDGNYSVNVEEGNTLVFSFIGMVTQKIVVGVSSILDVKLAEDTSQLDEVVVVGYGTQDRQSLTGSVATIKSEKLSKQAVFQTSQALQGLSPGLTAIQSSGQPGADGATLRVRGIGSINASSSPLIIVDGVEGSLNGVDSNDIESISVLKDAGAAAIYGNRGSNGVIVITTKRAKVGAVSVAVNSYVGFQEPTNQPNSVDAIGYLEATGDQALLDLYLANPNDKDLYPDTDWVDLLFSENGFMQYHNVSVSGGSDAIRSKVTMSFQDQDGNIPGFGFKRYQGRVNNDFKISDKLKVSLDFNFRRSDTESSPYGNGVNAVYRQPAIFPAIYSDGTYALPSTGGNPIAGVNSAGSNSSQGNYFRGILKAEYKPIPELTLSTTYSPEQSDSYNSNFRVQYPVYEEFGAPVTLISSGTNNLTTLSQSNNRAFTDNFYATANYNNTFGKHRIGALLGYEFIKSQWNGFAASRYDFIIQDFEVLNNGNEENDGNSGSADHTGIESLFGRFNYAYNNKYLLEFSIRRDASSKFSPEYRVGTFPSISAGWRISEESFMQNQELFSQLKIKGSWGQLGNQSIGNNFPYASLIAIGSSHFAFNEIQQGAAQQILSNPSISWETAEKLNLGFEFGVFDNRLSGSIEYYDNQTNDLLGSQQIPSTTGLSAPIANVYSMKNTGVDMELQWNDNIGEDFHYNIGGNFATVKNEVTDLNGEEFLISGNSIRQIGESVGSIFGFKSLGLFQSQEEIDAAPTQFGSLEPGDIRFEDNNSYDAEGNLTGEPDGIINNADRVIIGNSFPSVTYSFDAGFDYKGFDFSLAASGVGNREVFLTRNIVQPLFNAGNIFEWHITDSWTPENTGARFPLIKPYSGGSNNSRTNSTYVFDASYLRIRNITLGYSLPKNIVKSLNVASLRFFTSGQNLITFNKDLPDGIDPQIPNNSQGNVYPITIAYTFGFNLTF